MPYSSGTFSRVHDFTDDRDNGIRIQASRMDAEMDGIATGLSTALLKDGTQTATAKIPFAVGLSVIDNQTILLGTNSDIAIQYDETTNDSLEISANVEGAALGIVLKSDQGDDNADQHKLSIADGGTLTLGSKISGSFVSYLTHTPNSTVASSTLAVAGNLTVGGNLTLGSGAELSEAELEMLDGITAGTVAASKAVVVDANKDIASFRNITLTGELDAGSLDVSGDVDIDGTLETDALSIASTAVTATAAELNYNDTGAAVGTVVASKTVTVDANKDVSSFRNITLTGELDAGSLDVSGDADIDGTLEADAITVNGTALATVIAGTTVTTATNATNATHVSVADNESTNEENLIPFIEDASATGNVGLESDGDFAYNPSTGTVSATVFKGNIDAVDGDFDGTLEADAITVNGTALDELIQDTVGAMFSSNTETGITATYQDSDGTIDLEVSASGTTINNNADNRIITGSGTSNTLEGEANLTFDGSALALTGSATFTVADNSAGLTIVSTDADGNSGPQMNFSRASGSPADDDYIGRMNFIGRNDAGQDFVGVDILTRINDVSDGTEDASFFLTTMENGSQVSKMEFLPGETAFNQGGANVDFRVEGDGNANMLMVDASQDAIAVGESNPTRHSKTTKLLVVNTSTTGTDFALHVGRVATGAESQVCFTNGFGEVGSIKTNGTSTSFNTSSDYRLKENVVTEWDATTRLKQLKPSRFNFKTDADKTLDGFLAHEVSSIVPEAVNGEKDATQDIGTIKDSDGNIELEKVPESRKKDGQTWTKTGTENLYQDIDQSKLVPLLVKTIQELEARITTLESA